MFVIIETDINGDYPENEDERKALEIFAEKGIAEYHDGGYFITDDAIEFIVKRL